MENQTITENEISAGKILIKPLSEFPQESITSFAKKGFLLDKDSLSFLLNLENATVAGEILNKIHIITKSRIVSKKTINEHFGEIKSCLINAGKEKDMLIQDFFKSAQILKIEPKKTAAEPIDAGKYRTDIKVLSSNVIPYRRIEVKDFVTHFKNRYNLFKELLMGRKELEGLVSINKIGTNRNFSINGHTKA